MKIFWRRGSANDSKLHHVDGLIDWLLVIGMASLSAIALLGALLTGSLAVFGNFVLWALISALASLLVGAALGVLFGLPNVRRVEISQAQGDSTDAGVAAPGEGAPAQGHRDQDQLGYAESTNLEQVADWLTKIIVGLTLTQYASWEGRFARLSYDLGYRLMPSEACAAACDVGHYPAGTTIAGGSLLIFFTVLGFLIAYLWMRGYFITEMVTAKRIALLAAKAEAARRVAEQTRLQQAEREREAAREAQRKAEEEAERLRAEAKLAGTLQERDRVDFTIDDAARVAGQVTFSAEPARDALAEIQNSIAAGTDADDPWLGQFGGADSAAGLRLSATVNQSEVDPQYYDVALRIDADNADLRGEMIGKAALFFLHPTFGSEPRRVYFGPDGAAQLKLLAYGAFTVGVLVETGTKLELNLATIDAPEDFRIR